jgi:branched-chain amino acid transport system permease protein
VSVALQVLLTGLAAGSVYGLIAVGYSLIYRLTGIVYFALGDLAGFGVFLTLFIVSGRGPVTEQTASSWRFALALAAALAVVIAVGAGSYFAVIHPYLMKGSTVGWVAATLAIAFALQSLVGVVFDRPAYVFPDALPFERAGRRGIVDVGGATFQIRLVFVIALAAALTAALALVLRTTRFGRGLTAIASDVEGARLVGVPVERFIGLAFGLVGAIAVVIAVAAAPTAPFSVDSGALLGVKGLIAALVVGFVSPWRALAAGIVLGVLESAIANGHALGIGLGPAYSGALPLAAALAWLAFRSPARTPAVE